MGVSYREGVASHTGPESCADAREGRGEALTGERAGRVDETALASLLDVSKRTIRRMVARHELPPPVRFGGRSTWQVARVVAWFDRRADRLERQARRQADRTEGVRPAGSTEFGQ